MSLSRAELSARFDRLRQESHRAFEGRVAARHCSDFRASIIGPNALRAWREQWMPYGQFDWEAEERRFRKPTRFEVALWCGQELCGLAIGHPINHRKVVGVESMEGSPLIFHPLKREVTGLVIAAATEYGNRLKSRTVRFWDPNPDLVAWYEDNLLHCVPQRGHRLPAYCDLAI
jgi:hypothetical protein